MCLMISSPNHIKSDNSSALERFSGFHPKLVGSHGTMETCLCNPGPGKMILAHLCYIQRHLKGEVLFCMYIFKLFPPHVHHVMFPLL